MNPGQKIICIDDVFPEWVHHLYTALPKKDLVYVVRANTGGVTHEKGRRPSRVILLVGVNNPIGEASGQELGFQPRRFRLLDELKAKAAAGATHSTR